jgi:hypothetical protein
MRNDGKARKLAQYIACQPDFTWRKPGGHYNHMGATIADAVLQANRNYNKIVAPRVSLIRTRYSKETTTTAVRNLLYRITATEFLQYNNPQRARRFTDILELFYNEGVADERDLQNWLEQADSVAKFCKLQDVSPRTGDYLRLLVGLTTAVNDRHLHGFAKMAGVTVHGQADAHDIIHRAAEILGQPQDALANSIWLYMRGGRQLRLANEQRFSAARPRYWFRLWRDLAFASQRRIGRLRRRLNLPGVSLTERGDCS